MKTQDKFIADYFLTVNQIANELSGPALEAFVRELINLKKRNGRLFILGVGGSAGNAGHAVNDFRKLAGIESYAPTDNVSELTARTNDEGWETIFTEWLKVSKLSSKDAVLVLSVGGGNKEKSVSVNISSAIEYAKGISSIVLGIVGRADGDTARLGDAVIVIPEIVPSLVTPMAESFQALVWHMVVMHPGININSTKW
jgi:D-sedoheptulose 7-phosphate isomerase